MKNFLTKSILFIGLLAAMLSCTSNVPNCTMQQARNGSYSMINDNCKNCSAINVIDMNGRQSSISLNQASQMLSQPSAYQSVSNYNDNGNNTLETLLLYKLMFSNDNYVRNTTIVNRYSNQYNNYKTVYVKKGNIDNNNKSISSVNVYKPSNGFSKKTNLESDNSSFFKSRGFSKPNTNSYSAPKNKTYKPSTGFSKPSYSSSSYKASSGFSKPSSSSSSSSYKSSGGFKKK